MPLETILPTVPHGYLKFVSACNYQKIHVIFLYSYDKPLRTQSSLSYVFCFFAYIQLRVHIYKRTLYSMKKMIIENFTKVVQHFIQKGTKRTKKHEKNCGTGLYSY